MEADHDEGVALEGAHAGGSLHGSQSGRAGKARMSCGRQVRGRVGAGRGQQSTRAHLLANDLLAILALNEHVLLARKHDAACLQPTRVREARDQR